MAMNTKTRRLTRDNMRNRTEPSYVIAKVKRKLQYKMRVRRLNATGHMMIT